MSGFVSRMPAGAKESKQLQASSEEAEDLIQFNRENLAKLVEASALKSLQLATLVDRQSNLKREIEAIDDLIAETVTEALNDHQSLAACVSTGLYEVVAAVGEFQPYDADLKEVGKRELRMSIELRIPLDSIYLRIPKPLSTKLKRSWIKMISEKA